MSAGEMLQLNPPAELDAVELNQIVNNGITKTLFYRPENASTYVTVEDARDGQSFQIEVSDIAVPEGESPAAFVLKHAMSYTPADYRA